MTDTERATHQEAAPEPLREIVAQAVLGVPASEWTMNGGYVDPQAAIDAVSAAFRAAAQGPEQARPDIPTDLRERNRMYPHPHEPMGACRICAALDSLAAQGPEQARDSGLRDWIATKREVASEATATYGEHATGYYDALGIVLAEIDRRAALSDGAASEPLVGQGALDFSAGYHAGFGDGQRSALSQGAAHEERGLDVRLRARLAALPKTSIRDGSPTGRFVVDWLDLQGLLATPEAAPEEGRP